MSKSAVITTRLDGATADLIDQAAARHGQSRSWFVSRVLAQAAKREAEFLAYIQEGIDELDRGEGIPHEVVMAELDAMIAKHEARCQD